MDYSSLSGELQKKQEARNSEPRIMATLSFCLASRMQEIIQVRFVNSLLTMVRSRRFTAKPVSRVDRTHRDGETTTSSQIIIMNSATSP